MNAEELIAGLKTKDDAARTRMWLRAGEVGAPAVGPLAKLMTDPDQETARAAKRGLWQVVRHAGRPGGDSERKAVVIELSRTLSEDQPVAVRREMLWMISEIGGDESVAPVAALLAHAELREDVRMVLERIPGERSLAALQEGLQAAPADFKPHVAQSLRARGVDVPGLPDQKLVPTRSTAVKPVGR